MSKREPLMTEDFFVHSLSYVEGAIAKRNAILSQAPPRPQVGLYANFRNRYQQVFLGYSAGEGVTQLAGRFPAVVDCYEAYVQCPRHESTDLQDLDDYVVSLWLVSLAIAFNVDSPLWNRLLACIGNEGRDALFEALVATRTPNRRQTDSLLHDKIFRPLLNAIGAKGESRDAFVKRYLKDWYGAFKNAYWHDSHKGPEGGGFFGYWAVEVAGVVKAFNMDDSAFRDMAYYPRDLV